MEVNFKNKPWYDYLENDIRELLAESFQLIDAAASWHDHFHDYSFIVFPAAKAYEGYLKKLFLDMGFITDADYFGTHFRIGMSLNPQLEPKLRYLSVYDKVVKFTGDKDLGDLLWDTWKTCRNLVFHWFPDEKRAIDYEEAKDRVNRVIRAIDESYRECRINKHV